MSKSLGGWSMYLDKAPFDEFDRMMYGMVTNLDDLTTGTATKPGWSPEKVRKPHLNPNFHGKTLWVYGGGGCSPAGKPENDEEIRRIVRATLKKRWDGVDFDDECGMNISLVTEVMRQLKVHNKETSFGFVAGYSYNHPETESGKKLTDKIKAVIASGHCDRLVHYCYAAAMWNEKDIRENVRQALEKSIDYGMRKESIILALTACGLTDWSLNYFLEQVQELDIGGLYIWRYDEITQAQRDILKMRLGKMPGNEL